MNTQGVRDHRRLHRQVDVLGVVIASKFHGTIEQKIEDSEIGTV